VIQFSVKHEQKVDCGGGYIKLLPSGLKQENFTGDSQYNIMFGPDICGADKKVHVIFHYKGENWLTKALIKPEIDDLTHVYTLLVSSDLSYTVLIDQKEVKKGKIDEDFDMFGPKTIKDPDVQKPEEWDDRAKIPDPDDVKPEVSFLSFPFLVLSCLVLSFLFSFVPFLSSPLL